MNNSNLGVKLMINAEVSLQYSYCQHSSTSNRQAAHLFMYLSLFREPQMTYWSQYAVGLTQSLRRAVDRAEHQGGDNNVHRVVLD